jgi:chaperonin GroEL
VITDPAEHFKVVCASRNLAATVAIVDPELVMTAPKAIIAATAADALAHATESYLNLGSDPLLDSINIRAIRMIGQNAGAEGSLVVEKVRGSKDDAFGYNALTDTYENLVQAGVIDPTKVTRTALQNAASIAGLLLTTEAIVVEKKEEKSAPAAPGGGGMGGMY